MDQIQIDILSVLIAAILYSFISFVWYSRWLFKSALDVEGIAKLHSGSNPRSLRRIQFFANRLRPSGYVDLQKIEPALRSSNLSSKASFAIPSVTKNRIFLPVWNFAIGLVVAYFLAFFEGYLNVTTVSDGMFVGFCLWLGFIAPSQLSSMIWVRKDPKIFFLETSLSLFSLLVMSGVIGA